MTARGASKPLRAVAIMAVAALVSFHAIRNAAVADRDVRPGLAAALWPSHPAVLTDGALLSVAAAAARRQPVPPETRDVLRRIGLHRRVVFLLAS